MRRSTSTRDRSDHDFNAAPTDLHELTTTRQRALPRRRRPGRWRRSDASDSPYLAGCSSGARPPAPVRAEGRPRRRLRLNASHLRCCIAYSRRYAMRSFARVHTCGCRQTDHALRSRVGLTRLYVELRAHGAATGTHGHTARPQHGPSRLCQLNSSHRIAWRSRGRIEQTHRQCPRPVLSPEQRPTGSRRTGRLHACVLPHVETRDSNVAPLRRTPFPGRLLLSAHDLRFSPHRSNALHKDGSDPTRSVLHRPSRIVCVSETLWPDN